MPSFFSPSPSPGTFIGSDGSCCTFLYERFEYCFCTIFGARCLPTWGKHVTQHGQARYPTWASTLPNMGKHVTQHGQARYPTWASTLPHLGTFAARMLPICPQYGRLRLGLSRILLVLVFATNQDYLSLPV